MGTLDEAIKETMANALDSDSMKESIQKACDTAISRVIQDAFGYSSDFQKQLKAKVEEVMPVIKVDDLAHFTTAVRHVTQQRLVGLANEQAEKTIGAMLEQLVPDGRVITLDKLEQAFKEKISDYGEDTDSEYFEYLWEIESGDTNGYWDLVCSKDQSDSRYSQDSTTFRFREKEDGSHECWYARFGDVEVSKNTPFQGPLYGFDAMAFRLYTGTAKLSKD